MAADLLESSSLGRPGWLGIGWDELFEVDVVAVRRRSRVAYYPDATIVAMVVVVVVLVVGVVRVVEWWE
jgi:hypothetical protein